VSATLPPPVSDGATLVSIMPAQQLFRPFRLKSLELKNRIVMAPMTHRHGRNINANPAARIFKGTADDSPSP